MEQKQNNPEKPRMWVEYIGASEAERHEVRINVEAGWTYCYLWSEADARRLVTAVNSHTALVDALENAVIAMGRAGANIDTSHPMRPAWEAARVALEALNV